MHNFMVWSAVDSYIFVDLGENWATFSRYGISYIFHDTTPYVFRPENWNR